VYFEDGFAQITIFGNNLIIIIYTLPITIILVIVDIYKHAFNYNLGTWYHQEVHC